MSNTATTTEREQKINKLARLDIAKKYIEAMRPTTRAVEEFHLVCLLNLVSSLIMRKAYIRQGTDRIFPNLYSLIVAPSSRAKKSTAINNYCYWINKLEMGRYLISGIGSIEGFADALAGSEEGDNIFKQEGVGFVHYDEFGTLLSMVGKKSSYALGMLDDLNQLYGCGRLYRSYRKKPIDIPETYINIIASTQLDSLTRYIDEAALLSGFFPRFLVCYETHINPHIADRPMPDEEIMCHVEKRLIDIKEYISDLGFSNAKQYKLSEQAKLFHHRWSFKCDEVSEKQPNSIQTMMGRVDTLLFKICIILHFLDGRWENNIIDFDIVKNAAVIVNWHIDCYKNLIIGNESFHGLAFNEGKRKQNALLDLIQTKKVLSKSDIKRTKGWDDRTIAEIIDALHNTFYIDKELGPRGGEIYHYIEPENRKAREIEEQEQDQSEM